MVIINSQHTHTLVKNLFPTHTHTSKKFKCLQKETFKILNIVSAIF